MDSERLWDPDRECPSTQDKTIASMAHEDWGSIEYLMPDHEMPNRFHAMDWANGIRIPDQDMGTMEAWHTMFHDHHNTLAHIDY